MNAGEQLKYDSKNLTWLMLSLLCRKKRGSVLEVLGCSGNFEMSSMQLEIWEWSLKEIKVKHVAIMKTMTINETMKEKK